MGSRRISRGMGAIKAAYSLLPPIAQDAAISLAGVWTRQQRYGGSFRTRLAELRESEWWSADAMAAYQEAHLEHTLRHAFATVPFYREAFRRVGVSSAHDLKGTSVLGSLPILSKAAALEAGSTLRSSARLGRLRSVRTSGTTGTPLTIWKTASAERFQWAIWWRHRARFGVAPGDSYLTFGARVPSQSTVAGERPWRRNWAVRQSYVPVSQLTPGAMSSLVDWLDRTDHVLFTGYPSGMAVLAAYLQDAGRTLRKPPRLVATGSETLSPAVRELLSRSFSAPVTQLYGLGESVGGFAECERGHLHIDFELGAAEFLAIEGTPGVFRLVLTGLRNDAMPLIRYDTGDLVRLKNSPCDCGRSSMCVGSIDGRAEDLIRTPDGRKVFGLNQVFKLADGVREAQVLQERLDEIVVRLLPSPSFRTAILGVLESELRQRIGTQMKITFVMVDSLPREVSGKLRAVVSRIGAS